MHPVALSSTNAMMTTRFQPPTFEDAYAATFDFVWRNAIRLGVPRASIDDLVQDVFVVVHRQLPEFEGRSSLSTWVFTILRRTIKDFRRKAANDGSKHVSYEVAGELAHDEMSGPHETAARKEAVKTLHAVLLDLDEDRREVFLLAELEQWGAPEIAEALGIPTNTVYSRLRNARIQFSEAVARRRAKDDWRMR